MVSEAAIPAGLSRGPLRRRAEHRLVAGVAGGIADWLNAPVAFIRFLLGIALAWVPWMILAYGAAALLVPAAGRGRPDWDNLVGAARLGLIYGVLWLALPTVYLDERMGGGTGAWIATYALLGAGAAVLLSADYVRGRARSPEETRAVVLAALPVAAVAVLVAAGVVLVPDVRWDHVVPLVAIAGGATLLLVRRRECVAPAVLALGAAAVIVGSGIRLDGGVGDVRLRPAEPPAGTIEVRRAVGDVVIDLRRLRRAGEPITIDASVGFGNLSVEVPKGSPVEIEARVGSGQIRSSSTETNRVEGYSTDGQGYDERLSESHEGLEGWPPVRVVADVGQGELDIYRGQ